MWTLAWAFLRSRVGPFLKGVNWWVWGALLAALVVWLVIGWHGRVVKRAISAAETRGETRAYAAVEKKARELERKANELTGKIRSRFNEETHAIARRADAILVRGPGRAACPVAAPAASGARPADPAPGAGLGRVSYPEGIELIALPFPGAVSLAENHDQCWAEVKAWRSQNEELWKAWRER